MSKQLTALLTSIPWFIVGIYIAYLSNKIRRLEYAVCALAKMVGAEQYYGLDRSKK